MNLSIPSFLTKQDQPAMTQDTKDGHKTAPTATDLGLAAVPFMPRKAMSAKAAEAAAEWEQLESAYSIARQERDEARNRVKLLEEANTMLHEDLARAQDRASFFEKMNTLVVAKIDAAMTIIVSLQNIHIDPPPRQILTAEQHTNVLNDVLKQVEQTSEDK